MKKRNPPGKGGIDEAFDSPSVAVVAAEREAFEAIREARAARLEALGLTPPRPFVEVLRLARAVCSAERAVRAFQVAA